MKWVIGKIYKIKKWNEKLFSFIIHAPINSFKAGQFSKLAIIQKNNQTLVQRAYSFVNAPNNKNLEFYVLHVSNGRFTNLLFNLNISEKIMISKHSFGYFTLENIKNCNFLWMIATGTGIGPYLSILQENNWTKKFKKVILVHAVKYISDLVYLPLINNLILKHNKKLTVQTIISQEFDSNSLLGRIPELINNYALEEKIGIEINPLTSHVMLCGNPNMVKETQYILQNKKKLTKNLKKKPGQITTENYW